MPFAADGSASVLRWRFVVLLVCAIPGVLIYAPLTSLLFVALSMRMASVATGAVVLLLGLLIPHLLLIVRWKPLLFLILAPIASFVCIGVASITDTADKQHPQLNNVLYGLNANTGEAIWSTTDPQLDEWTEQFFSAGVNQRPLDDFFPLNPQPYVTGSAVPLALPAPRVTVLSDMTQDAARTLRTKVASSRQAQLLWIYTDQQTQVLSAAVNGKTLNPAVKVLENASDVRPWGIVYWAPPADGIELTLTIAPGQPVSIRVVDYTTGLPELVSKSFEPRLETMAPSPFIGIAGFSNATMVSKHFTFEAKALSR